MELTKQPATEMDYWKLIEGLGGLIWQTNHDLSHDKIEEGYKTDAIKMRDEAIELQGKLALEIGDKFGVIPASDYPAHEPGETLPPAPEGKIYYWDWYNKMKETFYTEDYGKIICSVCPLSSGLDEMISLGGTIPCGAIRGSINRLRAPYLCGMLFDWSREELYYEIEKKAGKKVLLKFQKKEEELKNKFNSECKNK